MEKYDLVIVGAGPAGLTAAIYGVRANLKTLLLESLAPGGQIINTNEIENYPGVGKLNGADLAMQMYQHAMDIGVEFDYKTVKKIESKDCFKKIYTEESDEIIESKSVIISTGARPRTVNVPGEEEYIGTGISWCAICDGAKYRDKDVVIIGGGNSAVDEGTYLAEIANSLTIITEFDLTADPVSCDFLRSLDNVTICPNKKVTEFIGENGKLTGVKFIDAETGEESLVNCDGVFEYIGSEPATDFIEGLGITNESGFIIADGSMKTAVPGVFAAGDCIDKGFRQVVTATSDGAIAAQHASHYIKELDHIN